MSTLAELICKCARRLGDAIMLEAEGGSTNSIQDSVNVVSTRRHWTGSQVFVYDAAASAFGGVGFVSAAEGSILSVDTTFPAAVVSGDKAIVLNAHGKGWTFDEYRYAINDAIGRLRGVVMIHKPNQAITTGWSTGEPTFTVPTAINELYSVEWYRSRYSDWVDLDKGRPRGTNGWSPEDLSAGTVRVEGPGLTDGSGADARCSGYGYQAELDDLDDVLEIPEVPVIEYAVLALTKASIERNARNPILFTPNEKDADRAISRYRTVRRRGTVQVRV